jgi:hypothetical protein
MATTREYERLTGGNLAAWRRWGPYVSERSWGTVREDYSPDGAAWDYFPHELARSKAYRWGEDGLAGICDRYQVLCFALAFWNERDPILKERLFGLVASEANHGEDVKENWYYLDSTPTHSYMKWLYKYPQAEYPYARLVEENQKRRGQPGEFELVDTGIFDDDRYFDVVVEYAKAGPEDMAIRITAFNRGPDAAPLHILPHLWFRNTWAWSEEPTAEPYIRSADSAGFLTLVADDRTAEPIKGLPFLYRLGTRHLYLEDGGRLLFTFNETNAPRVYGAWAKSRRPYVKDAFHRLIVNGERDVVNPDEVGTKAAGHYRFLVPARGSITLRLRLSEERLEAPLNDVDRIVAERKEEADEFYAAIQPESATPDERLVQRQALAGLLWSKQIYLYDVAVWLDGDNRRWPPPASRQRGRNVHWRHLNSMRIISMPDKWEYPWFAAWDLAFQSVTFALVDSEFAKEQLWMLLFEQFQHPSGQIPAYEWEFSDVNPPVHAWAVWRVYNMDRIRSGKADRAFLERCFHKLLINFAWWVNRVDREGNNIFEGGFLGLDNITILDRSEKLPQGATLEQSDASGWMGMFCLNLMRIALELAKENPTYEGLATKFFQHYMYVAAAMKKMGGRDYQLWDDEDGFFYDVLRYPDGRYAKFRVRSLVGLIPLYAAERIEERWIKPFAEFFQNLMWFLQNRRDLTQTVAHLHRRANERVLVLAIVDGTQMRRLLEKALDPAEFLSDYGLRSLSRCHAEHPFRLGDKEVHYEPGESESYLKGGNSNWRGPIWFPTTFLMIESLRKLGTAYGPDLTVRMNGVEKSLWQVAEDLANRHIRIFTRDASGRRAVFGSRRKFQEDPHWRDLIPFHEYFHGETGEGLGATHQTGWTALVASLIDEWRRPPQPSSR